MSILTIVPDTAGQVGVNPRRVKVISTDDLAAITSAGYLNGLYGQPYSFYPTDVFDISYNYDTISKTGIYGMFLPTFNGVQITLNQWLPIQNLLTSSITNPDTNVNLINFDVTCNFAQLQSGGSALLFASSGTKQYKIVSLRTSGPGIAFSGGNRNASIETVGAAQVYSTIPSANLITLANHLWGDAGLPLPLGDLNIATGPGLNLVLSYSGGTTDYTAGEIQISGFLQRVA